MDKVVEQLSAIGIVPVIRIDDVKNALPLANALCDGGLPCAEVTFRTAEAEEAIRIIAKERPEMLVGAGTVLTTDQVDRAVNAGAKFIVSPGLNPKIVKYCQQKGIPITPGTANASDIEVAIELGLDVVKFFPAEVNGGLNAIKALAAPYVNMKFMPTGGINAKNLNEYLAFPKIVACGGSWMVDPAMINAGDFAGITRLAREAVQLMLGFEVAHIGVNAENPADAEKIGKQFATLFGVEYKPGNSSVFAGSLVEVMKENGRGAKGHIGIATNSVKRARHYLESNGFTFDDSTVKNDANGNPTIVYLNDEVAGFAVHLLQKK
ncbi:bifunctional 4-hydroxy-2-oxoglutarate aldolase/2-dehydro-3-deoxy-phosphogluconate aldolase [Ruminococcaceae bacterium OttesenSCG-928-A16]|nr:bifunctional 4-hydroxy-2-oxoglutarate aldolase/2-dehydro-3-deoxy-phosphogluconate aldolase [Ruminococcaceae bacterium OttesenSCG-928-A16]